MQPTIATIKGQQGPFPYDVWTLYNRRWEPVQHFMSFASIHEASEETLHVYPGILFVDTNTFEQMADEKRGIIEGSIVEQEKD